MFDVSCPMIVILFSPINLDDTIKSLLNRLKICDLKILAAPAQPVTERANTIPISPKALPLDRKNKPKYMISNSAGITMNMLIRPSITNRTIPLDMPAASAPRSERTRIPKPAAKPISSVGAAPYSS
jgi:hypothetical protein